MTVGIRLVTIWHNLGVERDPTSKLKCQKPPHHIGVGICGAQSPAGTSLPSKAFLAGENKDPMLAVTKTAPLRDPHPLPQLSSFLFLAAQLGAHPLALQYSSTKTVWRESHNQLVFRESVTTAHAASNETNHHLPQKLYGRRHGLKVVPDSASFY